MAPKIPASPLASLQFHHAALRVPDFDTATAWYVEKFGLRIARTFTVGEKKYALMATPGGDGFIELVAGPGAEERSGYTDLTDSQKLLGWHHVAFKIADVDAVTADLKRRGVTVVSEPLSNTEAGLRFAFFADPWGNLLEVLQEI